MKKPQNPRVLYLGCAALATCALITVPAILHAIPALSGSDETTQAPTGGWASDDVAGQLSSEPATTSPQPEDIRIYYESLVADLQKTILELKEEDFVLRTEYESRIATLEAELELLEDIPLITTPPEPTEEPTTEAPTEPAPTMAFYYRIEDGHATVYEYMGTETRVTVPAVIDGYPVTHIADNAFKNAAVTSVTLPDSVTHIGWFAFAGCSLLHEITLPASVTSISYGAFENCPMLTLFCPPDSYAARYAVSFALPHEYI